MVDLRCKFDWQLQDWCELYLFYSISSPNYELSIQFASQICHESIIKPLDGTYLADFGIDINEKSMLF